MLTKETVGAKSRELTEVVERAEQLVRDALEDAMTIHEIETKAWEIALDLGHKCLKLIFDLLGSGDVGETVRSEDGRTLRRLDQKHARPYVSPFGPFELSRTVYAKREGKKHEHVPLDARLALPESKFSYLLQDWDQSFAVEQSFGQTAGTVEKMLGIRQHVDSLERMNRRMAESVEPFQMQLSPPPQSEEGSIIVETGDGKGVPLRRRAEEAAIERHAKSKGPKPGSRKMAVLGAVYTTDPYIRTPEEVVKSLFRNPGEKEGDDTNCRHPQSRHKRIRALLNHEDAYGNEIDGMAAIFGWMADEVSERDPTDSKEKVCIMDGQPTLWTTRETFQPKETTEVVEILDLLHVTSRLWDAAHLFCKGDSAEASRFVRKRVLLVLKGQVLSVVRGLRRMGTQKLASEDKRKDLQKICGYFENNHERMHYDEYLARGYPIASGVIEGACRNVVKDRLERTGMSWVVPGAQSMLNLRCIHLSGVWDEFVDYRIKRETERLYPYRQKMLTEEQLAWTLPA